MRQTALFTGIGDLLYGRAVTPAQCKAARHLLGWSTRKLAEQTSTSPVTVQAFERGSRSTHQFVVNQIQQTLEAAGIVFAPPGTGSVDAHAKARAIELTDGSTVRLRDENLRN